MAENGWLTLSELNALVRGVIEQWATEQGEVAVVAEIAEIRRGPTGHYYLKLVEKRDREILAQLDAVIWAGAARTVEQFRKTTGSIPKPGMQVLMWGRVTFHERYGLKFDIRVLDPTYTLGEMQRLKYEVIERLTRERLIDRNKKLPMPLVPQRIAVVASLDSAGYQDFCDQLARNAFGYGFRVTAYPALMQGDGAEPSIRDAFEQLAKHADQHDVVVLIRGGGSQVDLSCFDTYGVAHAIATSPLPVITGIGHERDETVADMVAHTRAKTPTAAAEVILNAVRTFEERVETAVDRMARLGRDRLALLQPHLQDVTARMVSGARSAVVSSSSRLHTVVSGLAARTLADLRAHSVRLDALFRGFLQAHIARVARAQSTLDRMGMVLTVRAPVLLKTYDASVEQLARSLSNLDPVRVLARGFSITRCGGALVRSAADVPADATIETTLASGMLVSVVKERVLDNEERHHDLCEGHRKA